MQTSNLHIPIFPARSVAEHVTGVIPIGNAVPEGGLHITVIEIATLSVAVGVVHVTWFADPNWLGGQVTTGSSWSVGRFEKYLQIIVDP